MTSRRIKSALVVLVLAVSGWAYAQLPERPVRVALETDGLYVSFSSGEFVDDSVRHTLASGLIKHFVLTVQAYSRGAGTPFATRQLTCAVTYDLWQEAYVVQRGRRREVVPTVDAALSRCLVVNHVGITDAANLARQHGREIYVAVRAEFNPISGSACARSLRRPGGDDPLGPVVVNIVRREICQAERATQFRSAYVRVP